MAAAEAREDDRASARLPFDQFLRRSSEREMMRSITALEKGDADSVLLESSAGGISSTCSFSKTGFIALAGLRRNSELRMRVKIQPMRSNTDCRAMSAGSFSSG